MKIFIKHKKISISAAVLVVLAIAGLSVLFMNSADKVKKQVIIEAGADMPGAELFLTKPGSDGKIITDISAVDTSMLGSTKIELLIGRKKFTSLLVIEDTTPPAGKAANQYIFRGSEIKPEDFVTDVRDATKVICSFAAMPDVFKPGRQEVTIMLTDEGENSAKINSRLYVFDFSDQLVIEAGAAESVAASDFIFHYIEFPEQEDLSFGIETDGLDFTKPGTYPVVLKMGQRETKSAVKIEDTTPPAGKPANQYIFRGNEIKPEDFVTDIQDITQVTCSFAAAPDILKPGRQEVTVILTDESKNSAEVNSRLYVFDFSDELVIEAGTVEHVTVRDFIRNYTKTDELSVEKAADVNFSIPGSYPVALKSGKYTAAATVKIADTTPPVADVKNCQTQKGKPIPAPEFVYNIKDVSPVTVRYKNTPDFTAEGTQTIHIILEDSHNNASEYKAELTVLFADTTPPVISGELNKWVVAGGTVAYRSGITVTDDHDPDVWLTVDSSRVKLNVPGTYTVIYSAADKSGNRAEVVGTVTVRAVDMDLVNEMADGILSQIIDQNMSLYEKAKVIFYWVHNKMKYTAAINSREIAQGAYNCFYRGAGDCYTYMAASRVLLTRAGIENMTVQRIDAPVPHYWNIVNVGEGWYHFDASPNGYVSIDRKFMFTESQAREFSQITPTDYENYKYDKSLVPEVVE